MWLDTRTSHWASCGDFLPPEDIEAQLTQCTAHKPYPGAATQQVPSDTQKLGPGPTLVPCVLGLALVFPEWGRAGQRHNPSGPVPALTQEGDMEQALPEPLHRSSEGGEQGAHTVTPRTCSCTAAGLFLRGTCARLGPALTL